MKNLKMLFCLLFSMGLLACSSTQPNANDLSYTNNFLHTNFKATNAETVKKPLNSDHQLMMALLNRPITADQEMMLAFATKRQQQAESLGFQYANYVTIKGPKTEASLAETSTIQPRNIYSTLIANDINAVQITGTAL